MAYTPITPDYIRLTHFEMLERVWTQHPSANIAMIHNGSEPPYSGYCVFADRGMTEPLGPLADDPRTAVQLVWQAMNWKARQVIKGWPRGRSSSGIWMDEHLMQFYPLKRVSAESFIEQMEDMIYHQQQQAMVDNFRRSEFLFRPKPPFEQCEWCRDYVSWTNANGLCLECSRDPDRLNRMTP